MGMDASACAEIMSCLNKVIELKDYNFSGDFGDGYSSVGYGFDSKDAKGYAIALVKAFGFRKSEDKDSTSGQLLKVLFPDMRNDLDNELLANIKPDYDTIKDIDAYAQQYLDSCVDTFNMYMRNASIAWLSRCVEYRDFGLICSFANVYLKEVAKIQENMLKSNSKHIGNIGDRITIRVVSARVLYTKYTHYTYSGEATYVNELVDEDGNVYIWSTQDLVSNYFNGSCGYYDDNGNWNTFVKGGVVTIVATVKSHSEYKGVKQTVITRGKVLE